jgi:hypothetical protein
VFWGCFVRIFIIQCDITLFHSSWLILLLLFCDSHQTTDRRGFFKYQNSTATELGLQQGLRDLSSPVAAVYMVSFSTKFSLGTLKSKASPPLECETLASLTGLFKRGFLFRPFEIYPRYRTICKFSQICIICPIKKHLTVTIGRLACL